MLLKIEYETENKDNIVSYHTAICISRKGGNRNLMIMFIPECHLHIRIEVSKHKCMLQIIQYKT